MASTEAGFDAATSKVAAQQQLQSSTRGELRGARARPEELLQVQKKTFTKWANAYLIKRKAKIDDLFEDLKDGIILSALLEIISASKFKTRINMKPRMKLQQLENLNGCFSFLKEQEFKIVNIGSSDINNGHPTLTLGLMWTIILRFQVAEIDIDGVSGKAGLLLWVKRSLAPYEGEPHRIGVNNFKGDWSNGLAFCALIHRYKPDIISMAGRTAEDALQNLADAFDAAETHLGVTCLLEADDVIRAPDEKSIITYVAWLYQHFSETQNSTKSIISIVRAIETTQRHDLWKAQYTAGAMVLVQWLRRMTQEFAEVPECKSGEQLKAIFVSFSMHQRKAKPQMRGQQLQLEHILNSLASSCRLNQRPKFEPEISTDALSAAWEQLHFAEEAYKRQLLQQHMRWKHADMAVRKLGAVANKIEAWTDGKLKYLKGQPGGRKASMLLKREQRGGGRRATTKPMASVPEGGAGAAAGEQFGAEFTQVTEEGDDEGGESPQCATRRVSARGRGSVARRGSVFDSDSDSDDSGGDTGDDAADEDNHAAVIASSTEAQSRLDIAAVTGLQLESYGAEALGLVAMLQEVDQQHDDYQVRGAGAPS
jgi:hypothetical protein